MLDYGVLSDVRYQALIGAGLFGLAAGAVRPWVKIAPWLASALAVVGYVALLAVVGMWAAQCWGCTYGTEDTRGFVFVAWMILGGAIAAALLTSAWAGVACSALVGWRWRTLQAKEGRQHGER